MRFWKPCERKGAKEPSADEHQRTRRQFMTTTAACVSASVASRFARSAGPEQVFDFTKPLDGWQTITGNWAVENVPGASRNERALVQRATDNEYNVILAPGGPYRDVGVS